MVEYIVPSSNMVFARQCSKRSYPERLVRCARCKHRHSIKHGNTTCSKLLILNLPGDFYCGYGEEADDGR